MECQCGCTQTVKPGNKFIQGHNVRINNPSKRIDVRKKISKANKGRKLSKEFKRKCSERMKGKESFFKYKKHSEETKCKMSEFKKGKYMGPNSPNWRGGCNLYWHSKAWDLFSQDKCEVCGMTNEEHLERKGVRLSMHCDGKRYKNLERIFWTTTCEYGCHQKLDALN